MSEKPKDQDTENAEDADVVGVDDGLDDAFGTGLEAEDTGGGSEITQPFDPSRIRVETKPMVISLLLDRITNGEIDLTPDFQRKGGIWSDKAKSQLIESLLIRIPLPAFYMDGGDENKWLVVDGLQRLSTMKSFVLDKTLKLSGMEFLKAYNGASFDRLPRNLQRRILETQVTVFLIQEKTPPEVKFNIFKRINTGGLPLSSQEIRHALNEGVARDVLLELAESAEFLEATSHRVRDERMGDRECILRLIAFITTSYKDYKSNDLDTFLNQRMAEINKMSPEAVSDLKMRCKRALVACRRIFGNRAFRKQKRGSGRIYPINRALFEVWAATLAELTPDDIEKLVSRKETLEDLYLGLFEDNEFVGAISLGTGDPRKVKSRFSRIETIIQVTLHG